MPDLRQLALYAEVSHYDYTFWFRECELKGDILLVSNKAVGSFIANCWGPKMRELVPTLTIRIKPQVEKTKPSILNKRGQKWEAERQATQARMAGLDD